MHLYMLKGIMLPTKNIGEENTQHKTLMNDV